MRFLLALAACGDGTRREGRFGVLAVIEQLQGFELATGAWESSVLAGRVEGYRREWLDELCMSGQACWGRLSVRDTEPETGAAARRHDTVPCHPHHAGPARRPAVAAARSPRRRDVRPSPPQAGPATCSTRSASAVRCSGRTWRR